MSSVWLSAAEAAGLPGLPSSEYRTRLWLEKHGVPSRQRPGREGGGGREFDAAYLPAQARAALLLHTLEPAAPAAPAPALIPSRNQAGTTLAPAQPTPPSRQDAACADARTQVLNSLEALVPQCGGVTAAVANLAAQLKEGTAPAELLAAAAVAHQRKRTAGHGPGVAIGVRTLFDWRTAQATAGWWGLLPAPVKPQPVTALEEDVRRVLQRYASTAGNSRNLTRVCRDVTLDLGRPFDDWAPLYNRARRALPKVDKARLIKARHTGAERAAKLPFKRRDTGTIRPLDVWLVDGHTFKAKVRHPDHGAPFAPEVTLVIDASTRLVTGWSVSLSENTIAVGDAIRHAVGTHGIPALVYSDNGAGERAKAFDCPVAGLFARLGTEHRTGIPGHPQGHGLIERSWQTHMIECARQFATYQGGDVDDRTLRKVSAHLAKEQRAVARAKADGTLVQLSAQCPSWQQFIDAVDQSVREYNDTHRHRSLPKIEHGPQARKHMTPSQAWQAMLQPEDQVLLDEAALRQVFMPATLRTAQRGEVRFLNAHYYSEALMQVDAQQVRVHYDIHDASRVWVWSLEGHFVCEAVAGANRMGYFPQPVVEMARRKRVAGMVKRREAQIDQALAELQPTLPQLQQPAAGFLPADMGAALRTSQQPLQMVERLEEAPAAPAAQAPAGRPFFASASERYEWLQRHRGAWTAADSAWLATYVDSDDYAQLAGYYASHGLAWQPPDDAAFKSAG
jgi:putative transposase